MKKYLVILLFVGICFSNVIQDSYVVLKGRATTYSYYHKNTTTMEQVNKSITLTYKPVDNYKGYYQINDGELKFYPQKNEDYFVYTSDNGSYIKIVKPYEGIFSDTKAEFVIHITDELELVTLYGNKVELLRAPILVEIIDESL